MATTAPQAMINNKREIFGWAMYDWANSAFSTTVGTVFLGPYIAGLAATSAEAYSDGLARFMGIPVAPTFLPYCVSFSVGLQVLFLPILGAIADYSHLRKQLMQIFATLGAIATILMFFVTGDLWWLGGVFLLLPILHLEQQSFSITPIFLTLPVKKNGTAFHPMVGLWDILAAVSYDLNRVFHI